MLPEEYNDFYTKNPRRWASIERDEMVFNYIKPHGKPKTLLEIGCGNGHLLGYIMARWPDVACTGIDFSKVAIDLAKKNAPEAELYCIDLEEYKPTGKFDMVLLSGVAEHFDEPLEKIKLISKLLKKKGVAYVEVPNCIGYATSEKTEGFRRINQGSRQMEWHLFRPTWEQIIKDAGFEIVESIKGSQQYWEFVWILSR